jgi:UDP-N-acetylglucosamine--N-acetylmuramyl-(pentapeptide) pyrophosphoryl-undecaprenol N-acetylglucosamine transferase
LKLLIGAGGTGGHIIPALAIALELRSRNWDVIFIGNKGSMEQSLISQNSFAFVPINVQKLYRKITLKHLRFPFLFLYSLIKSLAIIIRLQPDAVLCTGGFVSGPVILGSLIAGCKLFLQDGNSYPGLTVRLFARFSSKVFIASDEARKYLGGAECLLTGNPIMQYAKIDKNTLNLNEFNLRQNTRKLFVIGGSQGSEVINAALTECAEQLLEQDIDIIWQTGEKHIGNIKSLFGNRVGIHCFGFTDRMNLLYQLADIAIARAGALSIAELEEHRIPTVFIPLPSSAENHQYWNATAQQNKGAGLILEQKNLNSDSLLKAINMILTDFDHFRSIISAIPANNATTVICDVLELESGKKGR